MKGLLIAAATSVALVAQSRSAGASSAWSRPSARLRRPPREIGVRDGFLTFFARRRGVARSGRDRSAPRRSAARRTGSHARAPRSCRSARLMWEPFTGQMSGDGTLGWLTGAYVVPEPAHEGDRSQGRVLQRLEAAGQRHLARVARRGHLPAERVERRESVSRGARPGCRHGRSAGRVDRRRRACRGGRRRGVARAAGGLDAPPSRRRDAVRRARPACATGPRRRGPACGTRRCVPNVPRRAISASRSAATTPHTAGAQHGTWVRVWKRDVTDRWRIVFETSKQTK